MNGFGKRPPDTPIFKDTNGDIVIEDGDTQEPARRANEAQMARRKIAQPRGRARVTALAQAAKRFHGSSRSSSSNFSAHTPTNGATPQQSPFSPQSSFDQSSNPFAVPGTTISNPFSFTQSTGPALAFGSSKPQGTSPAADSAPGASSTANATSGATSGFNFSTTGQQSTPNPFSFGNTRSSAGGTSSATPLFQFGVSAQPSTPKQPDSAPTTNPFAFLSSSVTAPTTPFQFGATPKSSEVDRAASPTQANSELLSKSDQSALNKNNSASNLFNLNNNNRQGSSLFSSTPGSSTSAANSQPSTNSSFQFNIGQPAATTTSTESTGSSTSSPFKFIFGQNSSSAPPTSSAATVSSPTSTSFQFVFGQTAVTASAPVQASVSQAPSSTSSATAQSSEPVSTAKSLFSFPQTQAPNSSSAEAATSQKPAFVFDASPARTASPEQAAEKAAFSFGQPVPAGKPTANTASVSKPTSSSIFNFGQTKSSDSTTSAEKSSPQQQQPLFAFGSQQDQPATLNAAPGLQKPTPSSTFGFGQRPASTSEFSSAQKPTQQEQRQQSSVNFGGQKVNFSPVSGSSSLQKSTPSSNFVSGQRQSTTDSTKIRSALSHPPEFRKWVQRLCDIANSRYATGEHYVTFEQVAQIMDPTGLPMLTVDGLKGNEWGPVIIKCKLWRLNAQLSDALETVRKSTPLGEVPDFSTVCHVYNVLQNLITNEPEAWNNPFAPILPNGSETQEHGGSNGPGDDGWGGGSGGHPGFGNFPSNFPLNFFRGSGSGSGGSGRDTGTSRQGNGNGGNFSGNSANAEINNSQNHAKESVGNQPPQQSLSSDTSNMIREVLSAHQSNTAKDPMASSNVSADQSKTDKQQAGGKFGSFATSGGWKPDIAAMEKDKNDTKSALPFTGSLSIGSSIQAGGFDPKTGGWARKRGIEDVEGEDKTSGDTSTNSDQDHERKKMRAAETLAAGFGSFKHKRKKLADSEEGSTSEEGKSTAEIHPSKKSKNDAETPLSPTPKRPPFSFPSTFTPGTSGKVGTSTPPSIFVDGSSITRTPSPAISTSGRSSVLEGPHDNSIRSDNIFAKFASKPQQGDDDEKDHDSDDEEKTTLKDKPYTPTPGRRSLFDRISREPSSEPTAISKASNLFAPANGVGDHTWKPDSPIKFGPATSASEAPSTGASSNQFSNLFGASKTNVSSAPADAGSATVTANIGFTFGQNQATSSSIAKDVLHLAPPPSGASSVPTSSFGSATTSRATTPEGSSKEQAASDQEDEEPQADLFGRKALEEGFDIAAEWHGVRVHKSSPVDQKWQLVGVGTVLLLDVKGGTSRKSTDNPSYTILLRTEHGRNLLVSHIHPRVSYERFEHLRSTKDPSEMSARVKFPFLEGNEVRTALFTFRDADEAADFVARCKGANVHAEDEGTETETEATEETEDAAGPAGEQEVISISSGEEDDDDDDTEDVDSLEDGEDGAYVEDAEDVEYAEDTEHSTVSGYGDDGEEDEL